LGRKQAETTLSAYILTLSSQVTHKDKKSFATLWQTFAITVAKFCQSVARPITPLCINAFDHILPKTHRGV